MIRKILFAALLALGSGAAWADVQFAKASYSVNEGDTKVVVSVIRTGNTAGPISVSYANLLDGINDNATAGVDFTDTDGTLSWADLDATAKTITIPITNDNLSEPSERFTIRLSNPVGTAIGPIGEAEITIVDNDTPATDGQISFLKNAYSVGESDGSITINLQRTGGSSGAARATVVLEAGAGPSGAQPGSDFTDSAQTVQWADGEASVKSVTVSIIGDAAVEGDEQFTASIANLAGATLGAPSTTTITIVEDDFPSTPPPALEFTRARFVTPENGNNASDGSSGTFVELQLNGGVPSGASVNITLTPGSARSGVDYREPSSFTVTSTGGIRIPIIDDTEIEGTETFSATIQPSTAYNVGSQKTTTIEIIDNEGEGTGDIGFESPTSTVQENAGTAQIRVIRRSGSSGAVTVAYSVQDGSAVVEEDYKAAAGILSWGAGDVSPRTISISIIDDLVPEGDESLRVVLSAPGGGASLGSPSEAEVIIADNESTNPGTLRLLSSQVRVSETAGAAEIYIAREGGSRGAAAVQYVAESGTASAGSDFKSSAGTVYWENGDANTKIISVPLVNDDERETAETFKVTISNPSAGITVVGGLTTTVTIEDDDSTKGALQFSARTYSAKSKNGVVTIVVDRINGANGVASVQVNTVDGTAISGTDYTSGGGTLTWGNGDASSKAIAIPLNVTSYSQNNKTFTVTLTNAVGSDVGTPASASVSVRYERGPENTGCVLGAGNGPADPTLWLLALVAGAGLYARRRRVAALDRI